MLIAQCLLYLQEHPSRKVVFLGDFNVHNSKWICSVSPTDEAGVNAQHMCESFGLHQLVGFPTRGGNTLDLIISHLPGQAVAMANSGTSDHIAIAFDIQITHDLQIAPDADPVYDWEHAPCQYLSIFEGLGSTGL